MNCKLKSFCAFRMFLIGSFIIVPLLLGGLIFKKYQASKRAISYDEAISRIQSNRIKEININNDKINLIGSDNIKYSADVSENQKIELFEQGNAFNLRITIDNNQASPMMYLFQLLFWAFFLSPPIIVVLLLIIIKKMHDKSSMK